MEEIQRDIDRVIELLNRVEDNCNKILERIDDKNETQNE